MTERDDDNLAAWLAAERDGGGDPADLLFARVASSALRTIEPPVGLVDRVVGALPTRSFAWWRLPALAASTWVRVAVAAAVVSVGVSIGLLSPQQAVASSGRMIAAGAACLHAVLAFVAAASGVWRTVVDLLPALGAAALAVASTGVAPALIGANVFLSIAAFAGLKRLLVSREECA